MASREDALARLKAKRLNNVQRQNDASASTSTSAAPSAPTSRSQSRSSSPSIQSVTRAEQAAGRNSHGGYYSGDDDSDSASRAPKRMEMPKEARIDSETPVKVLVPASSPGTPSTSRHAIQVPSSSPPVPSTSSPVVISTSKFFAPTPLARTTQLNHSNGRTNKPDGLADLKAQAFGGNGISSLGRTAASHATAGPSKAAQGSSSAPTSDRSGLSISRIRSILPELTEEEIADVIDSHPDESSGTIMKRLRAKSIGQPYYPSTSNTNASSSHGSLIPPSYSPMASPSHQKAPKVKTVSAIYANRGKGNAASYASTSETPGRRREEQEDVSESLAQRPKKKLKMDSDDESDADEGVKSIELEDIDEGKALQFFNACAPEDLTGSIACTEEQAKAIVSLQPFASVEDLRKKLQKRKGVSPALFDQYIEVMQGYVEVDRCLNKCEDIGRQISDTMEVWTGSAPTRPSSRTGPPSPSEGSTVNRDTGLHAVTVDVDDLARRLAEETDRKRRRILEQYMRKQPRNLKKGITLKDYQLVGINWLNLLHSRGISCILADEMGLGKTIQVISFLAALKEIRGIRGPHLIVVPSSTLENWVREFGKFTADYLDVQTYYGSQEERTILRHTFQDMAEDGKLEVLLTTYDMAWKADDNKFLRKKIKFETCIFDEGHTLKNCISQRYTSLIRIEPKWRLLLTGTPLQNNLQELVSLLNFMMPRMFEEAEEELRQIFKVHSKGAASLLSKQRVSRARTMMTPFVLRRRKAQVLKDLPSRKDLVVSCTMTKDQQHIYESVVSKSRSYIQRGDLEDDLDEDDEVSTKKPKAKSKKQAQPQAKDNSSANILMELRKAAIHPLLFRRQYTDAMLRKMARDCMKEPEFVDSVLEYIIEDMEVMTDSELCNFCKTYKSVRKYALDIEAYMSSGKVQKLQEILKDAQEKGDRVLVFSQFVQVLDILEVILKHLGKRFLRLDGSTPVDQRQALVDEFTDDADIPVFLLSTKAGGMGINLVAANIVLLFDQDFNPHNDRQAADRAYRIGQTREVDVIKLISSGTIEEDIHRLGQTKIKLDDAVGGSSTVLEAAEIETEDGAKASKDVKRKLMDGLRQKLGQNEPIVVD